MTDDGLNDFLERDLAAPNPDLQGIDLVPAVRAAIRGSTGPAPRREGTPRLFLELYWGGQCVESRSFSGPKPVRAAADDRAQMPLWGFDLDPAGVVLAEQDGARFTLFAPRGASIERDGARVPPGDALTLVDGDVVRFASDEGFSLVARVEPPLPVPPASFLAAAPVLTLALTASLTMLFGVALWFAPGGDGPDYVPKNLSPVAVRLIAPEPKLKEVAKKKLAALKETSKEKVAKRPPMSTVKPQAFAKAPALKSLEKLSAAGPAMKDLLAAVDKLGGGPGKKDERYKLSSLLGKQPITNAGLGTFGLGGGGSGGTGTKGLEVLRGKGGAGIGALGSGSIGRGAVGGTVSRATPRALGVSGTIDREAVAKVINSHLAEVSGCYERALLRDPGLAGKIVLEWNISTSGVVTTAKTKSSTMKSSAVEACILSGLKTWKFPPAKGAGVVISYPFLFNSVGY